MKDQDDIIGANALRDLARTSAHGAYRDALIRCAEHLATLSPPEAQGSKPLDVEAMAHTLAVAFGKESRHNPAWILHNWHALCGISAPHHIKDCLRFMPKPAHQESQGTARADTSCITCLDGTLREGRCKGGAGDCAYPVGTASAAGRAPDNRYGDTLKYTTTADRPCGACSGIILKGALCYRYGNWTGDEPHTFQHLFHVDSGKAEAAPPHAPLSTQFVDAMNREDWHTATMLLIQKVDGLYRDEAPHASATGSAPKPALRAEAARRVHAYMSKMMGMRNVLDDQEQNWIYSHMTEFALSLPPSSPAPAPRETD